MPRTWSLSEGSYGDSLALVSEIGNFPFLCNRDCLCSDNVPDVVTAVDELGIGKRACKVVEAVLIGATDDFVAEGGCFAGGQLRLGSTATCECVWKWGQCAEEVGWSVRLRGRVEDGASVCRLGALTLGSSSMLSSLLCAGRGRRCLGFLAVLLMMPERGESECACRYQRCLLTGWRSGV